MNISRNLYSTRLLGALASGAMPVLLSGCVALLILTGCSKPVEERQAVERPVDHDSTSFSSTSLSSCAIDSIKAVSLATVSWTDTAGICEKMARALGKPPSIRLLQGLSKAVSTLSMTGRSTDKIGNAYQFMRIVESRGQLSSDDAMISTFDIVFKIANGTDGRVMPKDLNIFLSELGPDASKMSDDGLIHSAGMLSVMKQDKGE